MLGTIFICIIAYLALKFGAHIAWKNSYKKINKKDEEYYREILKEYSVAEISYMENLKIEERRDIVCTLLNLKLKNKIKINNNEITVIDSNTSGLKKTEKFILESIENGKVHIYSSMQFETYFMAEALEDGLISNNTSKEHNVLGKVLVIILILIILAIFSICMNPIVGLLIFRIIPFFSIVIIPIFFLGYYVIKITLHDLTEKGKELNKKIKGLKKYIQEYSTLEEKGKESLVIWEEYLIYSIIFGINDTTIVKEISKLIEIKHEYGKFHIIPKRDLNENQIIYIDNKKYVTINMIEYEKSDKIIQKYKINSDTDLGKWIVIEIDKENKKTYYLYEEYKNQINETEEEIFIKNKKYKLYRQGDTTIRDHFGRVNWTNYCIYYDYISVDENDMLVIEQWIDMNQILIGNELRNDRIEITNKFVEY